MSDENGSTEEAIEFSQTNSDAAFSTLMDFLAPETGTEETDPGDQTVSTPASADGLSAPETEGAGSDGADAAPATTGTAGESGVQDAGSAPAGGESGAGGDLPASWTVDANELADSWGAVSTGIEEAMAKVYTNEALAEVRAELPRYFEELRKHPRMLVGQEVPAINGEGMETLRDSEDAREWQEAIKALLVEEVNSRAAKSQEEMSSTVETLHSSVDLFKNNLDLVPGAKQFDRQLAERFVALVSDYAVRVDNKLIGYSVPVQPLINNLRTQMKTERDAAASSTAAPAPKPAKASSATPPGVPSPPPEGPQAGVPSQAGTAGNDGGSDFSTLFGTLGLPDLVI